MQRATWTDERLNDLARSIDLRFDQVDRRLDRIEDRIGRLSTTLMLVGGGILTALVGGIATGAIDAG